MICELSAPRRPGFAPQDIGDQTAPRAARRPRARRASRSRGCRSIARSPYQMASMPIDEIADAATDRRWPARTRRDGSLAAPRQQHEDLERRRRRQNRWDEDGHDAVAPEAASVLSTVDDAKRFLTSASPPLQPDVEQRDSRARDPSVAVAAYRSQRSLVRITSTTTSTSGELGQRKKRRIEERDEEEPGGAKGERRSAEDPADEFYPYNNTDDYTVARETRSCRSTRPLGRCAASARWSRMHYPSARVDAQSLRLARPSHRRAAHRRQHHAGLAADRRASGCRCPTC